MSTGSAPAAVPAHVLAVPAVDPAAFVAENALVLGDVSIGADSSVWFGCVLRGDVQAIRIGKRTNIQDGTVIHASTDGRPTLIGDDVTVGHAAVLHACTIESGAFVGIGARVLDGGVVMGGGMLAAGALLTPGKAVRPGELWAGSPARLLRPLTAAESENILVSTRRYVALARHYLTAHPAIYRRRAN